VPVLRHPRIAMPRRSHPLRALLAGGLILLVVPGEALAHGDPSTHYLETGNLYPSFSARPSQAHELALMGLLKAAAERGYPIKVSLIASADDLADAPELLEAPQRYAESVGAALGGRKLRAPVLVVTPRGFGLAGMQLRDGALRRLSHADARGFVRGVDVPAPDGDAMAAAASRVLRRLARAAGRPLPAHVAPVALPASSVGTAGRPMKSAGNVVEESAGSGAGWAPFAALGLAFLLAAVGSGVRRRLSAGPAERGRHHRL
jgi:hypothetical protein